MKYLSLIATFFLAACSLAGAGSSPPNVAPPLGSIPIGAPFRDEVLQFVQGDLQNPPPGCAVLFVGSSSIRLWSSLAEDMAPLPVLNRGFGGASISDVNRYFDWIVAPYRPRAIVLYAGENDIDAGRPPAAVAAEFRRFLDVKRAELGDTPVFFISAKPSKLRVAQLARQSELNAAIRPLAGARQDLFYIDVATPMLSDGEPRDLYVEDGLHMATAGYAIWRDLVRTSLLRANVDQRRCRD